MTILEGDSVNKDDVPLFDIHLRRYYKTPNESKNKRRKPPRTRIQAEIKDEPLTGHCFSGTLRSTSVPFFWPLWRKRKSRKANLNPSNVFAPTPILALYFYPFSSFHSGLLHLFYQLVRGPSLCRSRHPFSLLFFFHLSLSFCLVFSLSISSFLCFGGFIFVIPIIPHEQSGFLPRFHRGPASNVKGRLKVRGGIPLFSSRTFYVSHSLLTFYDFFLCV